MASRYDKIREVLAAVRRLRSVAMSELVADLEARAIAGDCAPFLYKMMNGVAGKPERIPCKAHTIRKHIRFCIELELLTENDKLSLHPNMRTTRNAKDIDLAINVSLLEFLQKKGADLDKIRTAISASKVTNPQTLYSTVGPNDLTETDFASCLNLLARVSDEIVALQIKQYVTKDG